MMMYWWATHMAFRLLVCIYTMTIGLLGKIFFVSPCSIIYIFFFVRVYHGVVSRRHIE